MTQPADPPNDPKAAYQEHLDRLMEGNAHLHELAARQNAALIALRQQVMSQEELPAHNEDDGRNTFDKVKLFFESTGNKPSSTTSIRHGAKVSRGALANVLYSTHARFFTAYLPEGSKRRLWSLKAGVAESDDLASLPAHECCRKILMERGNVPTHVLTLAKEAVRRGYHGKGKYEGDSLIWVTAKSFWARLSAGPQRGDFEQVAPNTFRLRRPGDPNSAPSTLFTSMDDTPADDQDDDADEGESP